MNTDPVQKPPAPDARSPASREVDLDTEIRALRRMIRRGHRRWKRLVLLEAAGLAVAAPLTYLWLMFAFDALFHLPPAGRWIASLIFFGGVVWQVVRLRRSWRRAHFTDDQVALAMERHAPGGLDNRLINSVQLAAEGSNLSTTLRASVVRENYERLHQLHVEQVARSRPALLRIGFAALAVLAGVAFRLLQPEHFTAAATRILLPFAEREPAYRTRLHVMPGHVEVERGGDVALTVRIEGEVPPRLLLITREEGIRGSEAIRVPAGATVMRHQMSDIRVSRSYALRGGDYVTPFYTIRVPVPTGVKRFRAHYRYPAYTGLQPRSQDGTSGDLEAVAGSEADLRVTVDRPLEALHLLFREAASTNGETLARMPLDCIAAAEFAGTVVFDRTRRYRVEMIEKGRTPVVSRGYTLTVIDDRPPDVQVLGLADGDVLPEDAVQALTLTARDDFGLTEVGLFSRLRQKAETPWEPLKTWTVAAGKTDVSEEWVLAVAATDAAEGDFVELLPRGRDKHPQRGSEWSNGQVIALSIGGEAAQLQIEYEQILAAEQGMGELIRRLQETAEEVGLLARRLDSGAMGRLDDRKTLETLAGEVKRLAADQAAMRSRAASIALEMPESAGGMKLSMGMLADTEMVRGVKAVERALTRDDPRQKLAGLTESRLTLERAQRGFQEIQKNFVVFREGWELEHMVPFTQMVSARQAKLGEVSLRYAELQADVLTVRVRQGRERRQGKVNQLTFLASTAFRGLSRRAETVGVAMAAAYGEAAGALQANPVKAEQTKAAARICAADWSGAAAAQRAAADGLDAIVQRLLRAQVEVARALLAKLRALAKDDVEAQAALKALQAGSADQVLEGHFSGGEISEMVALVEELGKKRFDQRLPDNPVVGGDGKLADYIQGHVKGSLDPEKERDFSIMRLAKAPSAERDVMEGFDTNDKLAFSIVENYEDVVGELLEEADDLRETYDSIRNLLMGQDIEAGSPGKGSLSMASASAAAPTGNQKPDTKEHGGVSRIGRQGARASGIAAGNESINRRGRDEAQESSQEVPDVAGSIKEKLSEDPATDHSTGVGGRTVEGELQKSFSVKDAGEWKDAMADRGEAPQSSYQIVERKGPPISPEVAEQLRALESQQEQLLSRIKQIKKELDNLFLPTEQIDEALRKHAAAMDRLRQQPDPEAFRQQAESLEKLMGAVMVFDRPDSAFQPSLPRETVLRGEILDESANPPLPGYEERVKRYYERLAAP
jgi:hypothetical protein